MSKKEIIHKEGDIFGVYKVIQKNPDKFWGSTQNFWDCVCIECGKLCIVSGQVLRRCRKRCGKIKHPGDKFTEREIYLRYQWAQYRTGAKKRGYCFEIDFEFLCKLLDDPCTYCGKTPSNGADRADNKIGYAVSNCLPCCAICNRAKREISKKDFSAYIHGFITKFCQPISLKEIRCVKCTKGFGSATIRT